MQDEVTFALNQIQTGWPDGTFPDDTRRVDRDDPRVLETGISEKEVDLAKYNVIAASLSTKPRTPIGTEFDYRVEAVVSFRVEATSGEGESWGQVDSKDDFRELVANARHALDEARSFPTVPAANSIGRVDYHSMIVGESVEPDLSSRKDHYRADFEARLEGYEEAP